MIKKILFVLTVASALIFAKTTQDPKFELKDISGNVTEVIAKKNGLDIPNAKGKIVFIEFWGTHCPPCIYSIPHYIELTKKYKDKVAMYAIEAQGTSKESLKNFAKSKGINYNLFTQEENIDFVRYIAQRAGWRGAIPFLIVLDTNGDVLDIKRSMVSKEYLEKIIDYVSNKQTKNKESNTTK